MSRALMGTALSLCALATAGAARADVPLQSPDGHVAKTSFDPGEGLVVGDGLALTTSDADAVEPRQELRVGLRVRGERRSGEGKSEITWHLDHRVFDGAIVPTKSDLDAAPPMDATLYRLTALRHDLSPSLVVPASPPFSLPFPFDVGFDAAAARVVVPTLPARSSVNDGQLSFVHVDVVAASLLLDPWRSGQRGRSFTIGVGAKYGLDVYGPPGLESPRVLHRLAPMTATSARFRWESSEGLWMLDARADVVPHWTSEGAWKLSMSSALHLERTLIGVNDQPLGMFIDGAVKSEQATRDLRATREARAALGLFVRLGG